MPFTILKLQDEEAMVLEMGMNHFGEISLLSNIAKPDICVITNIGTAHIGNLGSRENILKAKLEILEGAENPSIVVNNDNDLLYKWQEENKEKRHITTFGIENESNYQAKDIILEQNCSQFNCKIGNQEINIKVPVGGEHFVLNALCAVSVGRLLDIEINKIKQGIEEFELTKKRMEITELKNGIKIINDAYNAGLESMKASLKYLSGYKENRTIAVLGDMLELGEYAREFHEQVGEAVYENGIDILMCQGENAKYIAQKAKEKGMLTENICYFESKNELEQALKKQAKPKDVILIKASNGMKFYEIAEKYIS